MVISQCPRGRPGRSHGALGSTFQATVNTVRAYPRTAIIPGCLCLLLIGLSVFGVLMGKSKAVRQRKEQATLQAEATLSAFLLTVQVVSAPVKSMVVYLGEHPNYPDFEPRFLRMAVLSLGDLNQSLSYLQLQIQPLERISILWPDQVGGVGLDLWQYGSGAASRAAKLGRLVVDGPYILTESHLPAMIAQMAVFVPANFTGPDTYSGPDPAWMLPLNPNSPNACVNVLECEKPGYKWWGSVEMLVMLGNDTHRTGLLYDVATRLPDLRTSQWSFTLERFGAVPDRSFLATVIEAWNGSPIDPVVVSSYTVGDKDSASDSVGYTLSVSLAGGWNKDWWSGVIIACVVVSVGISLLVFVILVNVQQNQWLLHSMIPRSVVSRLRRGLGYAEKRDCCIMFADLVGFTRIASALTPEEVASMVNELFAMFEDLTTAHGCEKIDIIGDCFMCAAGMLAPMDPHQAVVRAADLALDMTEHMRGVTTKDGTPLSVRIGMHFGPVVVTVVGRSRPKLTVFGDVVNTASRLESTSIAGRIQVSDVAAKLIQGGPPSFLHLRLRGEIQLRNKGAVTTWWLMPRQAAPLCTQDPHHHLSGALSYSSMMSAPSSLDALHLPKTLIATGSSFPCGAIPSSVSEYAPFEVDVPHGTAGAVGRPSPTLSRLLRPPSANSHPLTSQLASHSQPHATTNPPRLFVAPCSPMQLHAATCSLMQPHAMTNPPRLFVAPSSVISHLVTLGDGSGHFHSAFTGQTVRRLSTMTGIEEAGDIDSVRPKQDSTKGPRSFATEDVGPGPTGAREGLPIDRNSFDSRANIWSPHPSLAVAHAYRRAPRPTCSMGAMHPHGTHGQVCQASDSIRSQGRPSLLHSADNAMCSHGTHGAHRQERPISTSEVTRGATHHTHDVVCMLAQERRRLSVEHHPHSHARHDTCAQPSWRASQDLDSPSPHPQYLCPQSSRRSPQDQDGAAFYPQQVPCESPADPMRIPSRTHADPQQIPCRSPSPPPPPQPDLSTPACPPACTHAPAPHACTCTSVCTHAPPQLHLSLHAPVRGVSRLGGRGIGFIPNHQTMAAQHGSDHARPPAPVVGLSIVPRALSRLSKRRGVSWVPSDNSLTKHAPLNMTQSEIVAWEGSDASAWQAHDDSRSITCPACVCKSSPSDSLLQTVRPRGSLTETHQVHSEYVSEGSTRSGSPSSAQAFITATAAASASTLKTLCECPRCTSVVNAQAEWPEDPDVPYERNEIQAHFCSISQLRRPSLSLGGMPLRAVQTSRFRFKALLERSSGSSSSSGQRTFRPATQPFWQSSRTQSQGMLNLPSVGRSTNMPSPLQLETPGAAASPRYSTGLGPKGDTRGLGKVAGQSSSSPVDESSDTAPEWMEMSPLSVKDR